jgi:hypothetical protein
MLHMRLKLVIITILIFLVTVLSLAFIFRIIIDNFSSGVGDPGNKHLTDLKTDAVFYVQPPGIQMKGSISQMPAQSGLTDFESAASIGPEVKESFVSDRPIPEIYQFYEQLAAKDGWHLRNSWSNGYAETWTKNFSDNATGTLSLENSGNYSNGQIYTLSGSIIGTSK